MVRVYIKILSNFLMPDFASVLDVTILKLILTKQFKKVSNKLLHLETAKHHFKKFQDKSIIINVCLLFYFKVCFK